MSEPSFSTSPNPFERTGTGPSGCPGEARLVAFGRGEPSSPDAETVADHVAGCGRCEAMLNRILADGDPLLRTLAELSADDPCAAEPECDRLEASARGIRFASSGPAVAARPAEGATGPRGGLPLPADLGSYRLLEKLGEGGMGAVYRALHLRLKRVVAVKVLPPDRLHDPAAVHRFYQEMEAVGRLDHPNVVRATDAGEASGRHFLVMDYVEGLDLSRLAQAVGPLPVADACELVRQAALGLHYAHEHGLVHRDVKPSNLMLTAGGVVKVLDLGLARLSREQQADDERLTPTGDVMGTPDYMAPEQAFDSRHVDIRADVYSLGCTLYRLLAGRAPFGGPEYQSRLKKMMAHAQEPVPPVREFRPEVPADLAAVLDRLLAKEPANRPPDPGEVARALTPFAAGADLTRLLETARGPEPFLSTPTRPYEPAGSPPASPTPPLPYRASRRRRLVALAAAAALLGLASWAALGGWWWPFRSSQDPPAPPADERPRELTRGVWHHLLDRRPAVLLWPSASPNSFWRHDASQHLLEVNCMGIGLFSLGEVSQPGYRLQADLYQHRWPGGAGLFLGLHADVFEGEPCVKYQRVELEHNPTKPQDQAWTLNRTVAYARLNNGRLWHFRTEVLVMPEVPQPSPHEHQLEITVGPRGLTTVRWAGRELPQLCDPRINARFTPADYCGQFGTFSQRSASVFRNARLLVH